MEASIWKFNNLRGYNLIMPRTILHLDLDAFFCSVEELHDPTLRGKAFAVGGSPEERGVVASCSYAARRKGVRSAMPMSRALRLCPGLLIIHHHHGHYGEMSHQVMQRLQDLSPLMEQISVDEAFVDISDRNEPSEAIARRLQQRVNDELGLPCSIGVATGKLVAKIATDVGKKKALKAPPVQARFESPNAITIVPPGEEAAFLAPLPVDMLWGVGPKTAARLEENGVRTIGDLARRPEADLVRWFGKYGRDMARHARGVDESPVVTEHETKSISQEVTFAKDVRQDKVLFDTIREQAAEVGRQLRKYGFAGTTIKLKLRWPDFTTLTRQVTLPQATDQDDEITLHALALLNKVRPKGKAVRLIGVGVSGLQPPLRQMELWGQAAEKRRKVQGVLDEVQQKFGEKAIRKGK
jgi:DNA polymerase IV